VLGVRCSVLGDRKLRAWESCKRQATRRKREEVLTQGRKDAKKKRRGVQGVEGRERRVGWAEGCREEGVVKSLRVLCVFAMSLLGGLATLREILFGFGFRVSGVRFAALELRITRDASRIPHPRMVRGAHAKARRRKKELKRRPGC